MDKDGKGEAITQTEERTWLPKMPVDDVEYHQLSEMFESQKENYLFEYWALEVPHKSMELEQP